MSNETIFNKACLVQMSTSIWIGTRALDAEVMQKINNNSSWLKGRKFLINPELLGPVKTAIQRARKEAITAHTLPFPLIGLYLVPKDSIEEVQSKLEFFRDRFWEKVREFESLYDQARQEAREILGDLFDPEEYPENIASKFHFDWKFIAVTMPGKNMLLSPEVYRREKEKFVAMVEEAREMGIRALHQELAENVTYLMDRLSGNDDGKQKILKASMFNRVHAFLEDLETKNIFNDKGLKDLAQELKQAIGSANTLELKFNKDMRTELHEQMARLKTAIDASLEEIPRRRIRMPENDTVMEFPMAKSA